MLTVSKNVSLRTTIYDKFPELQPMLDSVGVLDISKLMKTPYSALIGIIVGQKITYKKAKDLRKFIYETVEQSQSELNDEIDGTNFTMKHVNHMKHILCKLDNWPIIERVNDFLSNKESDYLNKDNPLIKQNIMSFECIKGIGPWTIQSTILCSLLDKSYEECDIFPVNDKFIQNALIRLYNINNEKGITKISLKEVKTMSEKWSPYRGIITWYFWRWF
jgi:3-methyladenine DNA glycosylase/8-oxoguanine DNA glycosylase